MTDPESPLAEPTVSPELYDEEYYTNGCAGHEAWASSEGATFAGIYAGILKLSRFQEGDVVVDIGAGRGELVTLAAELGAARTIGVEYSPTAVGMAQKTLERHGVTDRAEVVLADARQVPVDDAIADLVTLVDVVEHLSPDELHGSLCEARRMLKPGGRVFVHTAPNRSIYEVTYRLQRLLHPGRRRQWPADPRNDAERAMHVNEQTLGTLKRALTGAGFTDVRVRLGTWVYTEFVPDERSRRLYRRLAKHPFTARFGIADLFAEGTRT